MRYAAYATSYIAAVADNEQDALDIAARDAGYDDHADMARKDTPFKVAPITPALEAALDPGPDGLARNTFVSWTDRGGRMNVKGLPEHADVETRKPGLFRRIFGAV